MVKPILTKLQRHRPYTGSLMLSGLYVLFIIHLSLYPYQGWRQIGIGPLEFLSGPWIPVYQTILWRDIALNVLGYVPLGFLLLTGLSELPGRFERLLAPLIGIGLSLLLEATQTYIPIRVPSKVDWLTNAIGTCLGVGIGIWFTHHTAWAIKLNGLLKSWLIDKAWLGIGVLCLWCFSQLTPSNPAFVSSFWLGNAVLALFDSSLASQLNLPTQLIINVEAWGPMFATYAFLSSAWLIGLAQTRTGSPKLRLLLALVATTALAPTVAIMMEQPLAHWLEELRATLLPHWLPIISSIALACVAIFTKLQAKACGWLAIWHLGLAMLVMLFIPGVYDPNTVYFAGESGIWNSILSASHWVSEVWAFLALGVLAIFIRVNPQFVR